MFELFLYFLLLKQVQAQGLGRLHLQSRQSHGATNFGQII